MEHHLAGVGAPGVLQTADDSSQPTASKTAKRPQPSTANRATTTARDGPSGNSDGVPAPLSDAAATTITKQKPNASGARKAEATLLSLSPAASIASTVVSGSGKFDAHPSGATTDPAGASGLVEEAQAGIDGDACKGTEAPRSVRARGREAARGSEGGRTGALDGVVLVGEWFPHAESVVSLQVLSLVGNAFRTLAVGTFNSINNI